MSIFIDYGKYKKMELFAGTKLMLFYLSNLQDYFGPFRLFQFVTFRAAGAVFTAMLLTLLLGPITLKILHKFKTFSAKDLNGDKDDIPIMGGLLIIFSITASSLMWGKLTNPLLTVFLVTLLALGGVGFLDDYAKVKHKNTNGISGKIKLLFQFMIALSAIVFLFHIPATRPYMYQVMVPFLKDPVLIGTAGGTVIIVLGVLVVVGSSNAVNLTDGMDGLAVGCMIFCSLTYAAFAYLCGHRIFAEYLSIPHIPGAGEVGIFACAIAGACIGFLWFNCVPASMFMGDTGSLALGGAIGLIAVLVKQELVLIIAGGVFVIETGSVIIQVTCYKLTGKRVFRMTPIHHHFEKKEWSDTQIVVRFWILAGIFALLAMATLKIR